MPKNMKMDERETIFLTLSVLQNCYFCFYICFNLQIGRAEFSCPSWFPLGAKSLIHRILDPNPQTVSTCCPTILNSLGCMTIKMSNKAIEIDGVDSRYLKK